MWLIFSVLRYLNIHIHFHCIAATVGALWNKHLALYLMCQVGMGNFYIHLHLSQKHESFKWNLVSLSFCSFGEEKSTWQMSPVASVGNVCLCGRREFFFRVSFSIFIFYFSYIFNLFFSDLNLMKANFELAILVKSISDRLFIATLSAQGTLSVKKLSLCSVKTLQLILNS